MGDNGLTHSVIIALGTNTGHEANLDKAIKLLGRIVGGMKASRRLWTAPIGIESDRFMNQVVTGTCSMSLDELTAVTKRIEAACGRTAESTARGIVTADIDILQYDGIKSHRDDWDREYIKTLIKELI